LKRKLIFKGMLRLSPVISIFIITISFFSCQSEPLSGIVHQPPQHLTHQLILKDSIFLELDLQSSPDIYCLQYYREENQDSLFVFNHLINAIDVYSLQKKSLVHRLKIPKEGPNSIPQISGFYVHNTDYIFIYPKGNLRETLLSNFTGDHQLKVAPFAILNESPLINAISITKGQTILHKNKLFAVRYPTDYDLQAHLTGSFSYEVVVDLTEKTIAELPVFQPDFMRDGYWSLWAFNTGRIIDNKGQLIYNWPMSKDLFLRSDKMGDQKIQKVPAHLYQDTKKVKPFGSPTNDQQDVQMMLQNISYRDLYFDPYRKVYYRTALLPIPFDPTRHQGYQSFDHQPVAILVLDEHFNPIAEHYLPADTYKHFACFVGKDGLYIPRTNIYYQNLSESQLQFDLFQLVEK